MVVVVVVVVTAVVVVVGANDMSRATEAIAGWFMGDPLA